MANHDLVQCPLCHGHSQLNRNELIAILVDDRLREKIENSMAEAAHSPEPVAAGVLRPESKDFEKDVHTWNPQMPIWRRSPKE